METTTVIKNGRRSIEDIRQAEIDKIRGLNAAAALAIEKTIGEGHPDSPKNTVAEQSSVFVGREVVDAPVNSDLI